MTGIQSLTITSSHRVPKGHLVPIKELFEAENLLVQVRPSGIVFHSGDLGPAMVVLLFVITSISTGFFTEAGKDLWNNLKQVFVKAFQTPGLKIRYPCIFLEFKDANNSMITFYLPTQDAVVFSEAINKIPECFRVSRKADEWVSYSYDRIVHEWCENQNSKKHKFP